MNGASTLFHQYVQQRPGNETTRPPRSVLYFHARGQRVFRPKGAL